MARTRSGRRTAQPREMAAPKEPPPRYACSMPKVSIRPNTSSHTMSHVCTTMGLRDWPPKRRSYTTTRCSWDSASITGW